MLASSLSGKRSGIREQGMRRYTSYSRADIGGPPYRAIKRRGLLLYSTD